MKSLITLLLTLLAVSNIKGDYSINTFINFLQENGIYDLLVEIKYYCGLEISISFCKELYPTNDCETVVKIYMPNRTRYGDRDVEEKKPLAQIVNSYKLKLRKAGFTDAQINNIIKKMS